MTTKPSKLQFDRLADFIDEYAADNGLDTNDEYVMAAFQIRNGNPSLEDVYEVATFVWDMATDVDTLNTARRAREWAIAQGYSIV